MTQTTKLWIFVGFMAGLIMAYSVARSEDLPQAQPSDKLYRKTSPGRAMSWPNPGGMERVRLPDPLTLIDAKTKADIENYRLQVEDQRKLAENGRGRIMFWLPILVIACILTLFLKSYGLQMIGVVAGGVAFSYFMSGVVEVKMAERWDVATWIIVGGAILLVASFVVTAILMKDKGVGIKEALGKIKDKYAG